MNPELRQEIFRAMAQAQREAKASPSPEANERFVRAWTKANLGTEMGMADLIPSTPDVTNAASAPDWLSPEGVQLLNAPGNFGRGILSTPAAIAQMIRHPIQTAQKVAHPLDVLLNQPRAGEPSPGPNAYIGHEMWSPPNLPPAGTLMTPENAGASTTAEQQQALVSTLGSIPAVTNPSVLTMMLAGASQNPRDPFTAAGQGVGMYGAGRAAGAVASLPSALKQLGSTETAWRAIQSQQGGRPMAALEAQQALYDRTGRTANPDVGVQGADLLPGSNGAAGPWQTLLAGAQAKLPFLREQMAPAVEARTPTFSNQRMLSDVEGTVGLPSVETIENGMAAEKKAWSEPTFSAVRSNAAPVSFGRTTPLSIGEALKGGGEADPAAVQALNKAVHTDKGFSQWFSLKQVNGTLTPADLTKPIPGTGGTPSPYQEVLSRPLVADAIPDDVLAAVRRGGTVKFGRLMDAYQELDGATGAAFKRKDYADGMALAQARTDLGDLMATNETAFGQANAGFRRLSQQQESFYRGVQAGQEGNPINIKAAQQHPTVQAQPAPFQRGLQAAWLDKYGQGKNLAKVFKPAAAYQQATLAQTFPESSLAPLSDAARAERALAGQGGPMGSNGETMGAMYPTANPTILAMKLGMKLGMPLMRRSVAAELGRILRQDPATLLQQLQARQAPIAPVVSPFARAAPLGIMGAPGPTTPIDELLARLHAQP